LLFDFRHVADCLVNNLVEIDFAFAFAFAFVFVFVFGMAATEYGAVQMIQSDGIGARSRSCKSSGVMWL